MMRSCPKCGRVVETWKEEIDGHESCPEDAPIEPSELERARTEIESLRTQLTELTYGLQSRNQLLGKVSRLAAEKTILAHELAEANDETAKWRTSAESAERLMEETARQLAEVVGGERGD